MGEITKGLKISDKPHMETVSHMEQIMNSEGLHAVLSHELLKRLISLRRCNNERVGKLYAF